jgi:hypothetical protein
MTDGVKNRILNMQPVWRLLAGREGGDRVLSITDDRTPSLSQPFLRGMDLAVLIVTDLVAIEIS